MVGKQPSCHWKPSAYPTPRVMKAVVPGIAIRQRILPTIDLMRFAIRGDMPTVTPVSRFWIERWMI